MNNQMKKIIIIISLIFITFSSNSQLDCDDEFWECRDWADVSFNNCYFS